MTKFNYKNCTCALVTNNDVAYIPGGKRYPYAKFTEHLKASGKNQDYTEWVKSLIAPTGKMPLVIFQGKGGSVTFYDLKEKNNSKGRFLFISFYSTGYTYRATRWTDEEYGAYQLTRGVYRGGYYANNLSFLQIHKDGSVVPVYGINGGKDEFVDKFIVWKDRKTQETHFLSGYKSGPADMIAKLNISKNSRVNFAITSVAAQSWGCRRNITSIRPCSDSEMDFMIVDSEYVERHNLSQYAIRITRNNRSAFPAIFATDILQGSAYPKDLQMSNHDKIFAFHETTKQIVNDFFLKDEDPKIIEYKFAQFRKMAKRIDNELHDLLDLSWFCAVPSFNQKKNERSLSIQERFHSFTFDTEHVGRLVIDREGDEIIITSYLGAKRQQLTAFIFNVKNNTSKLWVQRIGGTFSEVIPSVSAISEQLFFSRDGRLEFDPVYFSPLFMKPYNEVFRGTIVELVNNTVSADAVSRERVCEIGEKIYYHNTRIISLIELISEKRFDRLGVSVLRSGKTKAAEQFLKADMPYMYLTLVSDSFLGTIISYHPTNDGPKDQTINSICQFQANQRSLTYLHKSSLTKSFGLSIKQLRILDKVLQDLTREGYESSYASSKIHHFAQELEVDISKLDDKTFEQLCRMVILYGDHLHGYYNDGKTFFSSSFGRRLLTNKPIIQKIKFVLDYGSSIGIYRDYLNFRETVRRFFGEEFLNQYPLYPTVCTKFIHYFQGTRIEYHYVYSEDDFKAIIEGKYADSCEFCFGENKELLGALVRLNKAQSLKHLHDELSAIISEHSDRIQKENFIQAVSRVADLEYSDDTLAIVTPKAIEDVRHEGSALHHCVGGFVDAISRGKTNIVFLRKKKYIECPYYTIEILNDGTVRQIHCYQNGNPTIEAQKSAYEKSLLKSYEEPVDVLKFLKKWAKVKQDRVKAESIVEHYGALAA